jgi:hypothetical protein
MAKTPVSLQVIGSSSNCIIHEGMFTVSLTEAVKKFTVKLKNQNRSEAVRIWVHFSGWDHVSRVTPKQSDRERNGQSAMSAHKRTAGQITGEVTCLAATATVCCQGRVVPSGFTEGYHEN